MLASEIIDDDDSLRTYRPMTLTARAHHRRTRIRERLRRQDVPQAGESGYDQNEKWAAAGRVNCLHRRDSDALLALVAENVDWPDGSVRLHGKDALRSIGLGKWAEMHTHDEPIQITDFGPDRSVVRVSEIVRALDGSVISEGVFDHSYQIENGLIVRMDIQSLTLGASPADVQPGSI